MSNLSLKKSQIKLFRYFSLMALICSSIGCAGYSMTGGPGPLVQDDLTSEVTSTFRPNVINIVSIIPFERGLTSAISEQDQSFFSAQLLKAFEENTSFEVTNASKPEITAKAIGEIWSQPLPREQRARKIAALTGAQGVIHGVLAKGEAQDYSFRIWLIDVNTNATVWQAIYGTSDKALSENIFQAPSSIKRGLLTPRDERDALNSLVKAATNLELINFK